MAPTALIVALFLFASVLAIMLYLRAATEKRDRKTLELVTPTRLTVLVDDSLKNGGMAEVIAGISRVLTDTLGCRRLIYLRRSGDDYEYEFSLGIKETGPARLGPCQMDLTNQLDQTTGLASVVDIAGSLPDRLVRLLRDYSIDLCFPVFWGNEMSGMCFMAGSDSLRLPVLRQAMATIIQTLQVRGNMHWHQAQYDKMRQQMIKLQGEASAESSDTLKTSLGMIELVRHRNSETLVGRIVDEVGREAELDRYSFFIPSKNTESSVRVLGPGAGSPVATPRRELVDKVLAGLDGDKVAEISALAQTDDSLGSFQTELQKAGLKYLAAFPLSADQAGILAWDDNRPAEQILARLRSHRSAVTALMANAASFEEVLGLSHTDGLTGLANHRFFARRLGEEIDRARRYARSLALIIFDLDELKTVNDRYGHQAGDSVLKQMGEVLRASVRSNDVIARYGGDEFCIIMPESDRATCARFIRRFQHKIATTKFGVDDNDTELTCTVSQGGAIFPDNGSDSKQLIYAADMALLEAKKEGRNGYRLA